MPDTEHPAPPKAPMRIAVIGNSGSGKSTLAQWIARRAGVPSLDLDTVAWEAGEVAEARDPEAAAADVRRFCQEHAQWVIEGCYAALIAASLPSRPHLILLDPGVRKCQENCRARPWEPHKFDSREAQDQHLGFLLQWVADYETRDDDTSRLAGC